MATITIIIAARSPDLRGQMATRLGRFSEFRILALTRDLMETLAAVEDQPPNLVIIEQRLSVAPEFEVMRAAFEKADIRWLLVRSSRCSARVEGQTDRRRSLVTSDLFEIDLRMPCERMADTIRTITRTAIRRAPALPTQTVGSRARRDDPLILIGASTGGVDALLAILGGFPADCPPTLVVQHTGAGFGKSLVKLLDRQCPPQVVSATDATAPARGQVVVAAGLRAHLVITSGTRPGLALQDGTTVSGHMPSVDMLFLSACAVAPRVAAALLTGMGRDGAQGLLALRRAGAMTYAQDAVTSVVYGMPRAAAELGAAREILPLQWIGPALLKAAQPPSTHERVLRT